ncbi:Energy-coupling factor transporter transmembrane protein EcfT [Lactobacillus helsingborgensis]|uniref:Energy-coupling factor transporter transmembrane protein EcfT n=1 Tax=Lactobacillus helsingborgensis TaxID=1218494 RepID=A0A0F4LYR4_9LACO|nr:MULTISPECIES: energy-coupling factor transporter transmembrane component T [Lactobacillus]AWN33849.1 energy-coupling factor transporter transmembrane protein EcfT [Lactobacillus helsingborgensis]KJY63434.1 Energy-coupling factor transporter transmembrane protein EcfT [Lactobacillus helsingborgensis]MCT6812497.1 energy-coupling factor transporter transmembrane protein EcfT [Lactobacillus helsingborgensis]MCT6827292.1 energy-coupling factor transporter transmembrane protein EcfT [Lactobacillus
MSKILIGRYVAGDSIIYRMDPRGKLLATILFILFVFLANNPVSYVIVTIFSFVAVAATKLKPKIFWDGVKPLIWLILFTSFLQLFFTVGGTVYWQWTIFALSSYGITNAVFIFIRFTVIILISTVMTVTTKPLEIADAIEWLLKPLKIVRVPVDKIALVMSIALRFVPTLFDETLKIMNAQRSRGADFNNGGLITRAKAITPLLVPLFINSLETAIDLSTAMESRGYRGDQGRTKFRVLRWSYLDLINLAYFILLLILLLVFRTH